MTLEYCETARSVLCLEIGYAADGATVEEWVYRDRRGKTLPSGRELRWTGGAWDCCFVGDAFGVLFMSRDLLRPVWFTTEQIASGAFPDEVLRFVGLRHQEILRAMAARYAELFGVEPVPRVRGLGVF